MQIAKQELEGFTQTLTFEFTATEMDRKLNREFDKLRKQVRIPGFRKGKTPVKMIRQRYGASVINDMQMNAINDSWGHVFKELKLNPLSEPSLNMIEPLRLERGLKFSLSFEVVPPFELPEPKSLKGEQVEWSVSSDRLDQEIEKLCERFGEWEPLNKRRKKSREGDLVTLDLKAFEGDEAVEQFTNSEFKLELGQPMNLAPLEKQVKGLKVDDELNFEHSFGAEDGPLAGRAVRFEGKVNNIEEKKNAEVDALIEKFSVESEDQLREQLSKELVEYKAQESRRELRDSVIQQLSSAEISLPPSVIERMVHNQLHHDHDHEHGECDHDDHSEEEIATARAKAEESLRLESIIHVYQHEHGISVSEVDFIQHMREMLSSSGEFAMQLFQFYQQPENRQRLERVILDEKVIDSYIESAELPKVERELDVEAEEA